MYISLHMYIVYVHGGRARLSVRISVDRHKAACTLIALHAPPIDTIPLHADSEAQRGCCAPLFARDYRAQRDERIGTILRFPDFSLDRAIIVLYFSYIVIPVFRWKMQQFDEPGSYFRISFRMIVGSCICNVCARGD